MGDNFNYQKQKVVNTHYKSLNQKLILKRKEMWLIFWWKMNLINLLFFAMKKCENNVYNVSDSGLIISAMVYVT